MIHVNGDLLGAAPGSDVLCARERHAPVVAREADEVFGDEWHRSSRAFLPRRVGRRVDDHLTDDSPADVVRVTAADEKPRERLGDRHGSGLRSMAVEMSKGSTHATAVVDRSGELTCRPSRLVCWIVDPFTVLAGALGQGSEPFQAGPATRTPWWLVVVNV